MGKGKATPKKRKPGAKAGPGSTPRRKPAAAAASTYGKHREAMAAKSRERSEAGREVGPHSPPLDPARKDACRRDFALFCKTYLPDIFGLPWAPAHLAAIERIQKCVLSGGQFAFGMPRGMGKSKLCEAAVLWAVLYGHRRFVVLIGSSADAADESLENIKVIIETNDLLHEDFGEATHYVRALEGITQRANAQTLNGERTRIGWRGREVVLPTVPGSPCSGSVIKVAGITGRIRGLSFITASGESIRPDLAIVDDPQKDEGADSPAGVAKIEKVINGAVLGLAGPRRKIAAFVPCTVIAPGDVADRLLDPEISPVWQGQRTRMVEKWPDRLDLWDTYADLRNSSLRARSDGREANEFYRANREAMDAGAVMSWPERFNEKEGEVSALQHAYNLRTERGVSVFDAEFQNQPRAELKEGRLPDLEPAAFAQKANNIPRGTVPVECTRLTAFIDCGKEVLWWGVVGWTEQFAGAVVDYGTWPDQKRVYFAKTDVKQTIAVELARRGLGGMSHEANLYKALQILTGDLLGASYYRADGGEMRIGLGLIDSGYEEKTVTQFVRQSPHAATLAPSKGYGVTSKRPPMDTWAGKYLGERKGDNWRQRPDRLVLFDTNHWKTFTVSRLLTPEGGRGSLYLFGKPGDHQLFADHLCAEYRTVTHGHGRDVQEWDRKVGRDNDWFDVLVGSAVAASVLGVRWDSGRAAGEPGEASRERKRVKLSELYAQKHARK